MQRAWQLHRLSKGLFRQDLNAQDATPWMGFRPSLPDSLPIIDRVADGKVLLAFGHQHLGVDAGGGDCGAHRATGFDAAAAVGFAGVGGVSVGAVLKRMMRISTP